MTKKRFRWAQTIILCTVLLQIISPTFVLGAPLNDRENQVNQEVKSLIPLGVQIVDHAVAVLSKG